MLQSIRDKSTGPFAYVVIGVISVPFAFFGIESLRAGGSDPAVAKVGDEKITQRQLTNAYNQSYQRFQQLMGENFDPAMVQGPGFRRNVLNGLITDTVLSEHVSDAGYRVGDETVAEYVSEIPRFQSDGRFNPEAYRAALRQQGRSPAGFEALVKGDLSQSQFRTALQNSALVAPGEVAQAWSLERQTRSFTQLTFPVRNFRDGIEIDPADVKDAYDASPDRFRTPERVRVAYVDLSLDALAGAAEQDVSDEALRSLYDAEKARYATPEERLTRHILVTVDDETSSDDAKAQIDAIRARIAGGEDFAGVAEETSDDVGSAAQGGSLDWVRRGMMVEPFEDALFALEAGALSQPVESEFGWHLIKLDEVRAESVQPFDEVRDQLASLYKRREAETRYQDAQQALDRAVFENLDSLQPAADAVGVEVQESAWFTRQGGGGIAAFDGVVSAAFSEAVRNGENSEVLQVAPQRLVALRELEREASKLRPLDEVRAQITRELENAEAQKRAQAAARQAQADLKTGTSAETIAEQTEAELATSGAIERTDTTGRNDARLNPQVVRSVFSLPKPAGDKPVLDTVTTASGDVVVVHLTSVEPARVPTDSNSDLNVLQDRLVSAQSNSELNAVRGYLQSETKIKVYEDRVGEPGPSGEAL